MQLTIADTPRAPAPPNGQPSTARRCCSNWLVCAPSIVQCPELCTRGAISFASSVPSLSNSSIASTPTYSSSSQHARHDRLARSLHVGREPARRRVAHAQDPVLVLVLDEGIAEDRPVDAASTQHRQLARERHECLRDERHATEVVPHPACVVVAAHDLLALAVVAAPSRLHDRRQPDPLDRRADVTGSVDRLEACHADAEALERLLLGDAVLRHVERRRVGAHGDRRRDEARAGRGYAFPFVRDDVGTRGHARERGLVAQLPDDERTERLRGRVG